MSVVETYFIERNDAHTFEAFLSAEEQERADRFRFVPDRERFVCSKGGSRWILSRILGLDPSEVEFDFNEFGKPFVESGSVTFNASHSGDLIVIAVNRYGMEVGVDVEDSSRDAEFLTIGRQFFSKDEFRALCELSDDELRTAFFRVWTRKEAFIKALGEGLSHPLDTFSVSHGHQASFLNPSESVSGARITSLELPEPYEGACVVLGSDDLEIRVLPWK